MAAFVRQRLRQPAASGQIDLNRWVAHVAGGRPLPQRLPLKRLRRWGASSALVLHAHALAEPLRADLAQLAHDALAWSAGAAPVLWLSEDGRLLQARLQLRGGLQFREVRAEAFIGCRHWLWAGAGCAAPPAGWRKRLAHAMDQRGSFTWLAAGLPQVPRAGVPAGARAVPWERHAPLRIQRCHPGAALLAEREAQCARLLAA
ncbi:hypothetical protein DBR42_27680, partial [Pelomonas sp. HMWF004]